MNLYKQLANEREERLGRISTFSAGEDMLDIINNGIFLFDPLRQADPRAIEENKETDIEMEVWYAIKNELPF